MCLPLLRLVCLGLIFLAAARAFAGVTLPTIFSDHMILLRSDKVPVWGKADPSEEIEVSIAGRTARGIADKDGRWTATLDLTGVGAGPFEMTVGGKEKTVVKDVLVGEVWLASGQSNMEWPLAKTSGATEEIARSANPLLRQFLVKKNASPQPADDVDGRWIVASPETSGSFSAVGYYFGKRLQKDLQVPVGLIVSVWGGTPSEAWTSQAAITSDPDLAASSERLRKVFTDYPIQRQAFVDSMRSWLENTGRADRPPTDVAAFTGPDISAEDWVAVKIPGEIRAKGLPEAGAVWVRRDIEGPIAPGAKLALSLPIDGFDSVYWNGRLLKTTTYETFDGLGSVRRYGPFEVPASDVNAGKNVLAIRLFQPAGPAKFSGEPKAGMDSLAGEWLAKAEFEFPPLAEDRPAPVPPRNFSGPQNVASFLFDGMIRPLIPVAIRGVIWYQGESNAGRAFQYRTAFPLLIQDWRKQWGRGDFPFYFCQLANFMAKAAQPGDSAWAELREAQSLGLAFRATGQAVLLDIGEAKDIHPQNKKDVGNRLALLALANDYKKDVPTSGPVFDSVRFEAGKAVVRFRNIEGGLVAEHLPETYDVQTASNETAPLVRNSPASPLEGFSICGADKVWHWADARIDRDTVIVSSPAVAEPVAVRYAWADNPTGNLSNGSGLPAPPFRTDDFPLITRDKRY